MKKVPRISQHLRKVVRVVWFAALVVCPFHSASVADFPYCPATMGFLMGAGFAFGIFQNGTKMQNKARHINRRGRCVFGIGFHIFSLECYRGRAPAPSVSALDRCVQEDE